MFSSSCHVHDSELQDAFVIDVDISQGTCSELTLMTLKKCNNVLNYHVLVNCACLVWLYNISDMMSPLNTVCHTACQQFTVVHGNGNHIIRVTTHLKNLKK